MTSVKFGEGWSFSSVTGGGLENLFSGCKKLKELDVSGWDFPSVDSLDCLFKGCASLTTLDVSQWDVAGITSLAGTFAGCSSLTTLDVSPWNTAALTNMSETFAGCSSLTKLDVSNWDVSQVASMSGAFMDCKGLTSLDLSKWNAVSLSSFLQMFKGCRKLAKLDLSGFDTRGVGLTYGVFEDCTSLSSFTVGANYQFVNYVGTADPVLIPPATAKNGKWWSTKAKRWFTPKEISDERNGVADTYLNVGERLDISKATMTAIASKTYTGSPIKPAVTVTYAGTRLTSGTDYTLSYANNTNAGTATITLTGKGDYQGTKKATFTIAKATNTIKGKTVKVKKAKLKKKKVTLAASKVLSITNTAGKVTYKKTSGNKKITVNKKTGKVTIKKGLGKGTYKVKVKVTVAESANYKKATKTVTFKIKVK